MTRKARTTPSPAIVLEDDLDDDLVLDFEDDDLSDYPPDDNTLGKDNRSVRQRLADLLDDSISGQSNLDRALDLLTLILASDHRMPSTPFSIHILPKGDGPQGQGVGLAFPELEKGGETESDLFVRLDAIEARAIGIFLALRPDLFNLPTLIDSHPEGLILDAGTVPVLSSHERLVLTEELRDAVAEITAQDAQRLVVSSLR